MAHLSERLSELRQDRGLTQKELADILRVGPSTISHYEHGKYLPDAETLVVLADYFHVTTDYLLGRTASSVSTDFLQQPVAKGKTVGDILHTLARLPQDRRSALALIISDMEINLMIHDYNKRGDRT